MESDLNKRLVENVLKHIPENKKPVIYLVNTLNISRESAYRRMRGDIPFTVEELITLATKLEFSIDDVYDQEKQNHAFFDYSRMGKGATNFFLIMLKKYNELLEKISYSKKVEIMMAFNMLPPPFYSNFNNLFKFVYYKWLYQDTEINRNMLYSEIVLPDEIAILQKKLKKNILKNANVTFILDMGIFLNLIKEMQYFHQRKFITNDELLLLKEEMQHFIGFYEDMVQTGLHESAKIQLYLSTLCVNSNTVCYKYDDKVDPLFWIYTINPVVIQNAEFASMQLKWFNSLKRQSALITQSNEILQAEFFFQQREYIDKYLSVDNAF